MGKRKIYGRTMDDKQLLKFDSLKDVRREFGNLHREGTGLYVKGRFYFGTKKTLKLHGMII